jgi:tRNA modification GTPase
MGIVLDDAHLWLTVRSLGLPVAVVVANKCDLLSTEARMERVAKLEAQQGACVCAVSAKDGTGLEALRTRLEEGLAPGAGTTLSESVLLSERQRQAIQDGSKAIGRAVRLAEQAAETADCADLMAFELREALDALGSVTGEVTTEDLLSQVFADFCIGK